MNGIFDVPDHGVHPFEYLELIVLGAAVGNDRFMAALGLLDSRKAIQSVGDNKASGAEVLCGPCCDLFLGEAIEMAQSQGYGMSFVGN